jgi:anti-sigma regulatory factor (Ser/Thr protein kinase)
MAGETTNDAHIRLEMLSQPRFVAGIRTLVGTVAQRLGFNETDCSQISLAVDEALCNVINHGYDRQPSGRIWLNIWAIDGNDRGIRIQIDDYAKQVEPSTIRSRDLDDIRPGGLGVHIIKQVMDTAQYEKREEGGMRLTLFKRLPAENEGATPQAARTTKDTSS